MTDVVKYLFHLIFLFIYLGKSNHHHQICIYFKTASQFFRISLFHCRSELRENFNKGKTLGKNCLKRRHVFPQWNNSSNSSVLIYLSTIYHKHVQTYWPRSSILYNTDALGLAYGPQPRNQFLGHSLVLIWASLSAE